MDDIKALMEYLLSDIKDVDKKKIKRKINTDHIKANINIDFGEKSDGYYVSKLRLINNVLDVPSQVKSQSLKLYIKFARFIDKNIENTNSYYLYNQLYILARDYVEDFVDPKYEKNINRIYDLINNLIRKDLSYELDNLAEEFLNSFPSLNNETKSFYNLTANGKEWVFWDTCGKLREKYNFSKDEEKALLELSQRRNVLWNNELLADLTTNLFLKCLKEVFSRDDINTNMIIFFIRPYTLSKNILDSLLLITEEKVRKKFSFLADIKTDDAFYILSKNNCDDIVNVFEKYQTSFLEELDDEKIEEIYLSYLNENPQKSKDIASFVASLDIEREEKVLKTFSHRENFREILDKLLKNNFTPTRVLALYYIFRNNWQKDKDKKILFEIIREENYEDFIELIKARNFDIDLVSDILDLRNIKAKRINLDKKLVNKSRRDLTKTVETINDFVGEDDYLEEEIPEKEYKTDSKDYNNISETTRKLLKDIIITGFITKEEAEDMAMKEGLFLNVFINNINDELYEYTNDQTLIVEEDRVIIDEFYVGIVKELIDG